MTRPFLLTVLAWTSLVTASPVLAQGAVALSGKVVHSQDLSGIEVIAGCLYLVDDETNDLHVLDWANGNASNYRSVNLYAGEEADFEALAGDEQTLCVLGSHSAKRKKTKPGKSYKKNRKRLLQIEEEPSRRFLSCAATKNALEPKAWRRIELNLGQHQILAPFLTVPGKENGVDIEGMTFLGGRIYLAFRSPVLRQNYVPIISMDKNGGDQKMLFVQLAGMGVRGLSTFEDHILILAGDPADAQDKFAVYRWNGRDMVQGHRDGQIKRVADLTAAGGAKPEGIYASHRQGESLFIYLVHDSVTGGNPYGKMLENALR